MSSLVVQMTQLRFCYCPGVEQKSHTIPQIHTPRYTGALHYSRLGISALEGSQPFPEATSSHFKGSCAPTKRDLYPGDFWQQHQGANRDSGVHLRPQSSQRVRERMGPIKHLEGGRQRKNGKYWQNLNNGRLHLQTSLICMQAALHFFFQESKMCAL